MSLTESSSVFSDNFHTFLAIFIGAIVGRLISQRRVDATQIRKELGSRIDKYRDVPAGVLDAALERAAWIDRPVLRFAVSVCGPAVWMWSAFIVADVFDRSYPDASSWCGPLLAGGVTGLLAIVTIWFERFFLLRRLEKMCSEPATSSP
jgi:hypothetical protein